MRWPFFGGDRGEKPISIELPVDNSTGFAVFFKEGDGGLPAVDTVFGLVKGWLARHSTGPFQGLLETLIGRGCLFPMVLPKSQLPAVAPGGVGSSAEAAEKARRLAESTHAVVVMGRDVGIQPHTGVWLALAAARALVEEFAGVAVDMSTQRLLPLEDDAKDLPQMGQIFLKDHLAFDLVRAGPDAPALVTRGMVKFGLPELVLRGVPDDLAWKAELLIACLASQLASWAEPLRAASAGKPVRGKLDPNCRLTMAQILAVLNIDPSDPEIPPGRATTLRFEKPETRSIVPRLRVIPAEGPAHDPEAAFRRMIGELFSASKNYYESRDELSGQIEARVFVAADLPGVKARFLAGLPAGTLLDVKHGFPTGVSGHEYMWVRVESWAGDRIQGRLANDPVRRADLHLGDKVELDAGDLCDWCITHPGGVREGARINEFLARAFERGEFPLDPRTALEIREEGPHIDGKIVNNSYSTLAPNIRASFWRCARYNPLFRFAVQLALVPALVAFVLGGIGDTLEKSGGRGLATLGNVLVFLAGLSTLAAIAAGAFLWSVWTRMAVFFENGLLTPGIVLSSDPLRVAVMACMSHGRGQPCWGIRRLDLEKLPAHPHEPGTRVPFVSNFEPSELPDRWAGFNPYPISYGAGRKDQIEACVAKLGAEEFDRLARCIERGLVPDRDDRIVLVDERLNVLETITHELLGSVRNAVAGGANRTASSPIRSDV
jgi:hypothetical protein